eukprot:1139322-Prorocentrum_minimum.AAC.2
MASNLSSMDSSGFLHGSVNGKLPNDFRCTVVHRSAAILQIHPRGNRRRQPEVYRSDGGILGLGQKHEVFWFDVPMNIVLSVALCNHTEHRPDDAHHLPLAVVKPSLLGSRREVPSATHLQQHMHFRLVLPDAITVPNVQAGSELKNKRGFVLDFFHNPPPDAGQLLQSLQGVLLAIYPIGCPADHAEIALSQYRCLPFCLVLRLELGGGRVPQRPVTRVGGRVPER